MLAELKARLGQLAGLKSRERLACSYLSAGIPRGILVEVSGSARTEFLIQFLVQNSKCRVAWVEQNFTLFPPALAQRGIDLTRCLFINPKREDWIWSVTTLVQAQVLECVVADGAMPLDATALRRLQLLAEKNNVILFLLRAQANASWALPLQVRADWVGEGVLGVTVLKEKAGLLAGPAGGV